MQRRVAKPAKVAPPPADDDRKSAIVTAKHPRRGRFGDVPDMTPEEHKRRGDAAGAKGMLKSGLWDAPAQPAEQKEAPDDALGRS